MPALKLDAALLHVHRSDQRGNVLTLSPDPFFDELMARAAQRVFVTAERIVSTAELDMSRNARFNLIERTMITGVVEARFGAHPTSAAPDYHLDLAHLKTYVDSASSTQSWAAYREHFIEASPEHYLAAVGGTERIAALPAPAY
jgi:glutaconate CoA-transferase subunit A